MADDEFQATFGASDQEKSLERQDSEAAAAEDDHPVAIKPAEYGNYPSTVPAEVFEEFMNSDEQDAQIPTVAGPEDSPPDPQVPKPEDAEAKPAEETPPAEGEAAAEKPAEGEAEKPAEEGKENGEAKADDEKVNKNVKDQGPATCCIVL